MKKCSIEAGRTPPWRAIVGEDGASPWASTTSARARPDKVLGEKFGFTVDAVTDAVRKWL